MVATLDRSIGGELLISALCTMGANGSVCVEPRGSEFVAGDVISGVVRVSVTAPIDRAEPIQLKFVGEETLEYDEVEQPEHRERHCSDHDEKEKSSHKEQLKHVKDIYTIVEESIILDVPARPYEPGTYDFPFEYQLPPHGLIPSFSYRGSMGDMRNVRAEAEYTLRATIRVPGFLKFSLRHACPIHIKGDPSTKVPRSLTESLTLPVYFLIFCLRGTCNLTATLEKDIVPVGGAARVNVLVNNESTQRVDNVTTSLTRIVKLNYRREGHGFASDSDRVASASFPGVEPGEDAALSVNQPIEMQSKPSNRIIPTMRSHFLSFEYVLTIRCRQSWCWKDPTVTFPIVLTTKLA